MPRATIQIPDNFHFQTSLNVRITDINYGGHLGNDTLLAYIHEARVKFLNHFKFSEKDVDGAGIIMADAVIIYKSQAYYGDVLTVKVSVTDLSKRACDLIYQISRDNDRKEIARAKTRIAFFDYQKNTTIPIPFKFRSLFEKT
ncbi:MAG: thioesterase family protein [bacterium]|nr:MAG: thioesterase family protein [bacterium]